MRERKKTDAEIRFENTVYQAVIGIVESLESQDRILGNGHHIAQKIASSAVQILKCHWKESPKERSDRLQHEMWQFQKEIYNLKTKKHHALDALPLISP